VKSQLVMPKTKNKIKNKKIKIDQKKIYSLTTFFKVVNNIRDA